MKLAPALLVLFFGASSFSSPMRFSVTTLSAQEAIDPTLTPSVEPLGSSGGGR